MDDDDDELDDPFNPHEEEEWENPLAPDDLDYDNFPDDEEDDEPSY